jgi:hypothetical protein
MPTNPKPKWHYWTNDEIRQLTLQYGRVPPAELAMKLGRTTLAVKNKANDLGLTRKVRGWSVSEERQLLEMYSTRPIPEVAKQLRRTEYAILARLELLSTRGQLRVKHT